MLMRKLKNRLFPLTADCIQNLRAKRVNIRQFQFRRFDLLRSSAIRRDPAERRNHGIEKWTAVWSECIRHQKRDAFRTGRLQNPPGFPFGSMIRKLFRNMSCGTETDHGRRFQLLRSRRKDLCKRHVGTVEEPAVSVPADRGKMHDRITGREKCFQFIRLFKPFPLKRDLFQIPRNHDPAAKMTPDETGSSGYADPNCFHLQSKPPA